MTGKLRRFIIKRRGCEIGSVIASSAISALASAQIIPDNIFIDYFYSDEESAESGGGFYEAQLAPEEKRS